MDSIKAARMYRKIRSQSLNKKTYEPHKSHNVLPFDEYDPSLTNQLVYGNRQDWYASAAIGGFVDVDLPIENGQRKYPLISEIVAIADKEETTDNGMSLY